MCQNYQHHSARQKDQHEKRSGRVYEVYAELLQEAQERIAYDDDTGRHSEMVSHKKPARENETCRQTKTSDKETVSCQTS